MIDAEDHRAFLPQVGLLSLSNRVKRRQRSTAVWTQRSKLQLLRYQLQDRQWGTRPRIVKMVTEQRYTCSSRLLHGKSDLELNSHGI